MSMHGRWDHYLAREDGVLAVRIPDHSVRLTHEVLLLQQPCSRKVHCFYKRKAMSTATCPASLPKSHHVRSALECNLPM